MTIRPRRRLRAAAAGRRLSGDRMLVGEVSCSSFDARGITPRRRAPPRLRSATYLHTRGPQPTERTRPSGGTPRPGVADRRALNHDSPRHRTRLDGPRARATAVLLPRCAARPFLYAGRAGLEDARRTAGSSRRPRRVRRHRAHSVGRRRCTAGRGPWPGRGDSRARSLATLRADHGSILHLSPSLLRRAAAPRPCGRRVDRSRRARQRPRVRGVAGGIAGWCS
jgi:hypothetical protein